MSVYYDMELLALPIPIRALLHGFGNAGITGWFLLFMFILISELLAQKRNVSEFWVGKLQARKCPQSTLPLFLTVALETRDADQGRLRSDQHVRHDTIV